MSILQVPPSHRGQPWKRLLWAPRLDFPTFRRQETMLILLNLTVMAGLMLVHAVFRPVVGRLTAGAGAAFALRFVLQLGEATYLNHPGTQLTARQTFWYARGSVIATIAFTVIVALLISGQESHYAVLMVMPAIGAAFRLSFAGLVATLAVIIGLTLGLVWIPAGASAPARTLAESFEATTVALIFVAVAVVVRLLAAQLWRHEAELKRSLDDLAAAKDRLVREEKLAAVGRLAAAVAHEVRNPVSMIASAVAAARRAGATPALRDEVFDIVTLETQRLQRLTEDFLTYARQRVLQPRPSSLGDALALVAGLIRGRSEELGVRLETRCQDAAVALDPFQIQQAMLNLAMNGLEATPRGGTLLLAAEPCVGGAIFAVENSGPALEPEVVARLYEPFYTTKAQGTGLGLPIARTIAQAHGGDVVLARNRPGQVRFELRIHCPPEVSP